MHSKNQIKPTQCTAET